jgi:hypothetical protein
MSFRDVAKFAVAFVAIIASAPLLWLACARPPILHIYPGYGFVFRTGGLALGLAGMGVAALGLIVLLGKRRHA